MIKVIEGLVEYKRVLFKDLKVGDTFVNYDSHGDAKISIKKDPIHIYNDSNMLPDFLNGANAVCLNNGGWWTVGDCDMVIPCDTEIRYKVPRIWR